MFVPPLVSRRSRPGNFLMNQTLMLAAQSELGDPDVRFLPTHPIITDALLRFKKWPPTWSFLSYSGTPPARFVVENRDALLSKFSNADLSKFPSSISSERLQGIRDGSVELKAIRAGDAMKSPRGGKYRPTPVDSIFHGKEPLPHVCAGQFPGPGPYRDDFLARTNRQSFARTSAIELFNLIRVAKVVTICPSSLHVFAALLGEKTRVYYPPIGHLDPNFRYRGSLLARMVPPGWSTV